MSNKTLFTLCRYASGLAAMSMQAVIESRYEFALECVQELVNQGCGHSQATEDPNAYEALLTYTSIIKSRGGAQRGFADLLYDIYMYDLHRDLCIYTVVEKIDLEHYKNILNAYLNGN